jgi:sarcosine oxidase subunit delta
VLRPGPPGAVSDAAWAQYLFVRDNPKGWVRERWVHAFGCRQWLIVVRNTVTHEIRATAKLTEPPPEVAP